MGRDRNLEDWATKSMNADHFSELEKLPNYWMVRKCDAYYAELKNCRQWRGRLHQYYVHGKVDSCENWKLNYEDCLSWKTSADPAAVERIVGREKERIADRMRGHLANDVWERRETPPSDWNKLLSDHLTDAQEESHLKRYREKQEELRQGGGEGSLVYNLKERAKGSCVVM